MPRNGPPHRRELLPDPVHRSVLVTQLVNKILSRGKRSLAERVVYEALDVVGEKTGGDPLATLKRALDNARPELEVKSRRVAARPIRCPSTSAHAGDDALDPLARVLRPTAPRADHGPQLANEILDASNGIGATVKRKEDLHKMAESNKAFAHYRW